MMRASLTCVFAILVCAATGAQTTRDDLSTSFQTTSAKLELNARTDLARRVEATLLQQARFLTNQLHPWEKDSSALLLFKGSSTEQDIRSNAHFAYGLATIARAMQDNPAAA